MWKSKVVTDVGTFLYCRGEVITFVWSHFQSQFQPEISAATSICVQTPNLLPSLRSDYILVFSCYLRKCLRCCVSGVFQNFSICQRWMLSWPNDQFLFCVNRWTCICCRNIPGASGHRGVCQETSVFSRLRELRAQHLPMAGDDDMNITGSKEDENDAALNVRRISWCANCQNLLSAQRCDSVVNCLFLLEPKCKVCASPFIYSSVIILDVSVNEGWVWAVCAQKRISWKVTSSSWCFASFGHHGQLYTCLLFPAVFPSHFCREPFWTGLTSSSTEMCCGCFVRLLPSRVCRDRIIVIFNKLPAIFWEMCEDFLVDLLESVICVCRGFVWVVGERSVLAWCATGTHFTNGTLCHDILPI